MLYRDVMVHVLESSGNIKDFILRNVEKHPQDITAVAMQRFGMTRPAILHYINQAIAEKLLTVEGATRARRYRLHPFVDVHFRSKLFADTESAVWRYRVLPHLKLPANVLSICEYGFTEMLNNAIDHSEGKTAAIFVRQTYDAVEFCIIDHGVGIFEHIQKAKGLESPQEALLELSKGKLTTYPAKHAGEGIYFTSRMFDHFIIRSGALVYSRRREEDDDWLIDVSEPMHHRRGTFIYMRISTDAEWSITDVFNKYQDDDLRFRRTHVPIGLAREPGQQLVSRSQAKRLLARFELFTEVLLDFQGVDEIGQGFADEVFRIFPENHPAIPLIAINTTPAIDKMIAYVKANAPQLHG